MDNNINIQYIENASEEVQLDAVKRSGLNIRYIKNPSEAVQLIAVNDARSFQHIENPPESVKLAAVKCSGYNIVHISKPSKEVQLAAVNQDDTSIQYIHKPSKEVQLAAVNSDSTNIRYISNPSEEVQLVAVNKDGHNIRYIHNPSEDVQLAAVNKDGTSIRKIYNPSEKIQLAAVIQNPRILHSQSTSTIKEALKLNGLYLQYALHYATVKTCDNYIARVSDANFVKIAANQNGLAIKYLVDPDRPFKIDKESLNQLKKLLTDEIILDAVTQNGLAIQYVKSPKLNIKVIAIKQNGLSIQYISKPSESLQITAVTQNGLAIQYIDEPSEKVQIAAIKQNKDAVEHILDVSEKVKHMLNNTDTLDANITTTLVGSIYIFTSPEFEGLNRYKIGLVNGVDDSRLKSRLSGLTCSNTNGYFVKVWKNIPNVTKMEKIIHSALDEFHYDKEWFEYPNKTNLMCKVSYIILDEILNNV